VNWDEGEVFSIGFNVSTDLSIDHICSPVILNSNGVASNQLWNPRKSTISGHSSISISWIVQNLYFVEGGSVGKVFINPLRTNRVRGILNIAGTQIPGDGVSGVNMECRSDFLAVEIGNNGLAECARWEFLEVLASFGILFIGPRSIISWGGCLFISLQLVAKSDHS
jgi:hypothetical protein